MADEKTTDEPAEEAPAEEPAGSSEPQGEATPSFDPRFEGEEYEGRQLSEEE